MLSSVCYNVQFITRIVDFQVRDNILFGSVFEPTRYEKAIDVTVLQHDLDLLHVSINGSFITFLATQSISNSIIEIEITIYELLITDLIRDLLKLTMFNFQLFFPITKKVESTILTGHMWREILFEFENFVFIYCFDN